MHSLIDVFLSHKAAEEKTGDTLIQYGGVLRRFERWLITKHSLSLTAADVPQITGLMLTEYYQLLHARRLEVSTRNNYTVILKEFFGFLSSVRAIPADPSTALHCVKPKAAEEPEKPLAYTVEQVEQLLGSIANRKPRRNNLRDTAIVALILATGLRASEACSLNVAQMEEIRQGSVRLRRKGGNWKTVEVGDFAVPHLERYLRERAATSPDAPLFVSQKGNRLTRNALWKSLATKQRRADVPTGVHILRHTVLTAIEHDGSAALARDIGGHRSLIITNRYVHTTPEERKTAVDKTAFAGLLA